MPAASSPLVALAANALDVLAAARNPQEALAQLDLARSVVAGADSIFSIQLNVTTARDPRNEVRLRRLYSSAAGDFPVEGGKHKTRTPWTERVFILGQPFVGEGAEVLARHFDDYEQLRAHGLQSVVNVPLLQGPLCYATFNVFGTRGRWQPHEVLGIRLLALAAARWVSPFPGLSYTFEDTPLIHPLEA